MRRKWRSSSDAAPKYVPIERAFEYVLGYMNFNDVSARDFQFADGQWQRGKACDTFAPMGPFILMRDLAGDPHALRIQLRLNGKTMQDSSTAQLIFGVDHVVSFLSRTITLEPGDVIATGTPPGVGFARKPPVFLKAGDVGGSRSKAWVSCRTRSPTSSRLIGTDTAA